MALFDELAAWDGATPAEREAAARALALQLPSGFAFKGIRRFTLGGTSHEVAQFTADIHSWVLGCCFLISKRAVRIH